MRAYAFALAALMAACSSTGSKGQKALADLTGEIDGLVKQLEAGKTDLQKVIAEHDAIVDNTDGDFVGHYKKFSKGIDTVEKQREKIRERVQKVKDTAAPYFATWRDDNTKIGEASLRERDKMAMEATQKRYEEIHSAGEEAKAAYEPLMAKLKDHRQVWSNNLNATSAAAMKKDADGLKKDADKVYGLIDKVIETAKKYNASVAMREQPKPPAESSK
jgi:chromosome segregation ATPase